MILFCYLDQLPKIPERLITQQEKLHVNYKINPARKAEDGEIVPNVEYIRWDLDEELDAWIRKNVANPDTTGVQQSLARPGASTHLCHTDSHPRRWVLNYTYSLGGDNVNTRFFKEVGQPLIRDSLVRPVPEKNSNIELIYSTQVEVNRWWLLNSSVLHDAVGITGSRESITLGINTENPFSVIPLYQDSVNLPV